MSKDIETKHLKTRWIHLFNNTMHKFFIDKNVLDIGCLDGYSSYQFVKHNAKNVVGIDIEPKYIEEAKLEYLGITFKIQDAEEINIDYDLNNIDVVSCLGLIYLLNNPIKFLSNMSVQNKADTIIIETVYNNAENYSKDRFYFLNINIIKKIFTNNNWKISLEKTFTTKDIDHKINENINFANRIVLVFERLT